MSSEARTLRSCPANFICGTVCVFSCHFLAAGPILRSWRDGCAGSALEVVTERSEGHKCVPGTAADAVHSPRQSRYDRPHQLRKCELRSDVAPDRAVPVGSHHAFVRSCESRAGAYRRRLEPNVFWLLIVLIMAVVFAFIGSALLAVAKAAAWRNATASTGHSLFPIWDRKLGNRRKSQLQQGELGTYSIIESMVATVSDEPSILVTVKSSLGFPANYIGSPTWVPGPIRNFPLKFG